MDILIQMSEALKNVESVAYLLPFLFLFGIGYLLKEYTSMNNKAIPWVLFGIGCVIGFISVAQTLGGVMIGALMSFAIMWFYDTIRESINTFFRR